MLGVAVAGLALSVASAQPAPRPPKASTAKPNSAKGAPKTAATKQPHGPRSSASQEAARLGTAIGHDCNGRAAMQRNERQWVVLCSNGRTYVLDTPGIAGLGAPATQCSLAGIGPEPACFGN